MAEAGSGPLGAFGAFVNAIIAAIGSGVGGLVEPLTPLFYRQVLAAERPPPGSAEADVPLEVGIGGIGEPGGGAIGDISITEEGTIAGAGGFGSRGIAATVFTFGKGFQGLGDAARAITLLSTGFGPASEIFGPGASFGLRVTSFGEAPSAQVGVTAGPLTVTGGVGGEPLSTEIAIGADFPPTVEAIDSTITQVLRQAGGLVGLERAFAFGEFVRRVLSQPFESIVAGITSPESFVHFRTIADVPPPERQVGPYPVWGQVAGMGGFASG